MADKEFDFSVDTASFDDISPDSSDSGISGDASNVGNLMDDIIPPEPTDDFVVADPELGIPGSSVPSEFDPVDSTPLTEETENLDAGDTSNRDIPLEAKDFDSDIKSDIVDQVRFQLGQQRDLQVSPDESQSVRFGSSWC